MNQIFVIMGKSSSGKDTLFKELLKEKEALQLEPYISYTTRPIRSNEKNGSDYFFISNDTFNHFIQTNQMLEHKEYQTIHGIWKYGMVYDNQFNTNKNILIVLTLERYLSLLSSSIITPKKIIPIYIEVDDGERLTRALEREKNQASPKYEELCRRFLSDSRDFSEENLQNANITKRFQNHNFSKCLQQIKDYIVSFTIN